MDKINIKLVKSLIGRSDKQIKTAASLGLKKIGDESSHEEGAVLDGKLKIIAHMVCVTNADAKASAT
ncbi:MAG: 50S ribosomal protein L30 [Oscillospiraceae bacterium]|nr:50S ribosomal protein L30 [Oscillospiraceae bacterium]